MTIRVRLFASLREAAGTGALQLELREGGTVADALRELSGRPGLSDLLAGMPVQVAVNREYAGSDTPLTTDDELALIPPISGGAGPHTAICAEPLDVEAITRRVADPGAGAIVCFQGVTRTVPRLDYEAYREMAEPRMSAILAECMERHDLLGVAAEHRVGAVPLGEAAVVVAASAAHREEAFAGAREAIDRIKAEAPIWKQEISANGQAEWVEGQLPSVPEREPGR